MRMFYEPIETIKFQNSLNHLARDYIQINKVSKRQIKSFVNSPNKTLLNRTKGISYLKVRDQDSEIKRPEKPPIKEEFDKIDLNNLLSQTFNDSFYNLTQLKDDDPVMSPKNLTFSNPMIAINNEDQIQNIIRKRLKLSTFVNEESRNSHHNLNIKCIKIEDKDNEKNLSGTINNSEIKHCFSPVIPNCMTKTLFSTKGSTKDSKYGKGKINSEMKHHTIDERHKEHIRINKKPYSSHLHKRLVRRKESSNSEAFHSAILGSKVPILKKPLRRASAFCLNKNND